MKFAYLILFQICCGFKESCGPSTNQNMRPVGLEVLSQSEYSLREHTLSSQPIKTRMTMSSPVYCCLLVYTKTDFRKKKKSKTRKILTNRWSNIFVLYLTESQTNRDFRGESVAKEASVSTKQPSLPSCCQRKRETFCFCAFTICDSKTFETPPFLKNQCIKRENIVHNFLKKFLKKTTKLK